MSRPPSWASFTRPIDAAKPTPPPANVGGVAIGGYPQPYYHYPFSQPVVTAAPVYPAATAAVTAPAFLVNGGAPAVVNDQDASIRGLLADILGGGDGSNAKPIPGILGRCSIRMMEPP